MKAFLNKIMLFLFPLFGELMQSNNTLISKVDKLIQEAQNFNSVAIDMRNEMHRLISDLKLDYDSKIAEQIITISALTSDYSALYNQHLNEREEFIQSIQKLKSYLSSLGVNFDA